MKKPKVRRVSGPGPDGVTYVVESSELHVMVVRTGKHWQWQLLWKDWHADGGCEGWGNAKSKREAMEQAAGKAMFMLSERQLDMRADASGWEELYRRLRRNDSEAARRALLTKLQAGRVA